MYGFQLATQVLVSADVAAGQPRRARRTALSALRMACLAALATAAALHLGRASIAATLVRDPLVTKAFESLVPPAMVMLLIYGVMWAPGPLFGAFRSWETARNASQDPVFEASEGALYGLGCYAFAAQVTSLASLAAVLVMLHLGRQGCGS